MPQQSSSPEPTSIVVYVLRDAAVSPAEAGQPALEPMYRPAMVVSRNTDGSLNLMVFQNGYEDHGVVDDDGHWWPGLVPRAKASYGQAVGQWLEPSDINWADFDLELQKADEAFPKFPEGPSQTFKG